MHSAKDGFVVNAEYLGRGLFSKSDMVEEEQAKKAALDCRTRDRNCIMYSE